MVKSHLVQMDKRSSISRWNWSYVLACGKGRRRTAGSTQPSSTPSPLLSPLKSPAPNVVVNGDMVELGGASQDARCGQRMAAPHTDAHTLETLQSSAPANLVAKVTTVERGGLEKSLTKRSTTAHNALGSVQTVSWVSGFYLKPRIIDDAIRVAIVTFALKCPAPALVQNKVAVELRGLGEHTNTSARMLHGSRPLTLPLLSNSLLLEWQLSFGAGRLSTAQYSTWGNAHLAKPMALCVIAKIASVPTPDSEMHGFSTFVKTFPQVAFSSASAPRIFTLVSARMRTFKISYLGLFLVKVTTLCLAWEREGIGTPLQI
ncbi:hypothetical protein B0H17DRAFT_1147336 [Mycena rosella]|uniref:Uncharacterized protein n=1 Tax=Mycena rosella TaxID=1033263 RepID=A0AAD7CLZ9_MYCRO|nr:hypothetical protein B0H17DRAFT_1147336 [Mycena rosella]